MQIIAILIIVSIVAFIIISVLQIIFYIIKRKKYSEIDQRNNTEKAEELFVNDIERARNLVLIATGNSGDFYNRENIKNVLKNVNSGKKVVIVSGDLISGKDNPLFKTARDNMNIELNVIENVKYLRPHFRIIDNKDVYIEKFHEKDTSERIYHYFKNNRHLARKYRKKFLDLIEKANLSGEKF